MKTFVIIFGLVFLDCKLAASQDKNDVQHEVQDPQVQEYLTSIKEEMKDVPNPLIAIYTGSEFGDYYYLTFVDPTGRYLDFGNGKNDLGDFYFGENDTESNSDLVGKVFVINWGWKTTRFACCEGSMESHEGLIPGITEIQLISDQSNVTKAKWIIEEDDKAEDETNSRLFIEFEDYSIKEEKKFYVGDIQGIPMAESYLKNLPNRIEFFHAGISTKIYADWDGAQLLKIYRTDSSVDFEEKHSAALKDSLVLPQGSIPIIILPR